MFCPGFHIQGSPASLPDLLDIEGKRKKRPAEKLPLKKAGGEQEGRSQKHSSQMKQQQSAAMQPSMQPFSSARLLLSSLKSAGNSGVTPFSG